MAANSNSTSNQSNKPPNGQGQGQGPGAKGTKEVTSASPAPAVAEHMAQPVNFDYTTTDPGASRISGDKFKTNSGSVLTPETKDGSGNYNPLSAVELRKIIASKATKKLFQSLSASERGFLNKDLYTEELLKSTLGQHLGTRFSQLSEELLAYPRAKVNAKIAFYLYADNFDMEFNLFVGLYPQEEGRYFQGIGRFLGVSDDVPGGAKEQKLVQKLIDIEFNTDAIPPDALRIIHNLPVPIATKVPGSTHNGAVSLVDVYKLAGEKERTLIVEEYGKEVE